MKSLIRLSTLALAFILAGCDCDPEIGAIAPQIYLDVCDKPQRKVNGQLIGGFEECGYDFGARDISVKATKNIKVTNPSIVELTFFNVEIIGDPSFKVELAPDTIGAGFSGDIIVSVRPKTETAINAVLYVYTDANNTQQTPDSKSLVEIPLTALGVDNGLPDIEVTPLACEYDHVPIGGVKVCDVTIKNTGNRGLVLDAVTFTAPGEDPAVIFDVPPDSEVAEPFAFVGRPPGPDEEIAPTTPEQPPVVLSVRFTPDVLGNYQGKFNILSNDPDEESIDVTLSGIGVTPPTCRARIKSIEGVDVPEGTTPQIEPLDDVVFTLEDSTPSAAGGSIAQYQWQNPPDGPPASHVQIANETAMETGFHFDSGTKVGVDFAGEYTVCGQVFDNLGTESVNECCVTFEAVPQDNFLTELSWDTSTSDIDLHVTKKNTAGQYCAGNTSGSVTGPLAVGTCGTALNCNWATCRYEDTGSPDWDGDAGRTEGDPVLDVDDLEGFGPENINVDAMAPGEYLVSVEGFTLDTPTTGTTVRIFVFGRLAGQFFYELGDNEWWEVAVVHWPADLADGVCIEDLTDGDSTDECG